MRQARGIGARAAGCLKHQVVAGDFPLQVDAPRQVAHHRVKNE